MYILIHQRHFDRGAICNSEVNLLFPRNLPSFSVEGACSIVTPSNELQCGILWQKLCCRKSPSSFKNFVTEVLVILCHIVIVISVYFLIFLSLIFFHIYNTTVNCHFHHLSYQHKPGVFVLFSDFSPEIYDSALLRMLMDYQN